MNVNVLIVGGSSGLGLEIGKLLLKSGATVCVTGRSPRFIPQEFQFMRLDITDDLGMLARELDDKLVQLAPTDLLVYAAGFFERGRIAELLDTHIVRMINVGLTAPAFILRRIIRRQESLEGFIAVTSTSQWIPREWEPVYAAVKAGLAMFAQSVSLDRRVKKTLVVGPAGMNTNFWTNAGRDDTHTLLHPRLVGEQILRLWNGNYTYRLARILRDPTPESKRVQILETR